MVNTATGDEGTILDALWRNFTRLGRDGMTTLVVPWLAIAAVDFVFVGISIAVVVMTGGIEAGRGGGVALSLINLLQMLLVFTLRVALLKTLRDVAFRGPVAVRSFGAVLSGIGSRLLPSFLITLVVGAIVSVGFVFCVLPGFVALFFLAFAPYLVAAKGVPIGEALAESISWARREWALLLSAVVVAILATSILACSVSLINAVGPRPALGMPFALVGGWFLNTILGYIAFLWWGAVYVTAEGREQLRTFHETAPGGGGEGGGPRPPAQSPAVYEIPPDSPYSSPDGGGS